ncbi:MAG TPA: hypothetical protein VE987_07550, partial [Polyangiaceae bacterium]|nr:hypothetical protein [Polyangiaceae bacterium]
MRRRTPLLRLVLLPASLVVAASSSARAQTSGPTISQSGQIYPDRIVKGQDLGPTTRPLNLNPYGINHDDCVSGMILRFNVLVSGFVGSSATAFEVWGTNNGDCTAQTARAVGSSAPTCWKLAEQASPNFNAPMTVTIDIDVRDIVGPQAAIPQAPGVAATRNQGQLLPNNGACEAQPTFSAVPMYIWFMAVDGSHNVVGTPYEYGSMNQPFVTDLIGPPPPANPSVGVGDTLLTVNWTPNLDTDTAGYDVFMDPLPGKEDAAPGGTVSTILYCLDSGSSTAEAAAPSEAGDDGSSSDAAGDATTDASDAASSSGGATDACIPLNTTGPPPANAACNDPVLVMGLVQDSGTVTTP